MRAARRRSRPSRRAAAGARRSCAPPRRRRSGGPSAPRGSLSSEQVAGPSSTGSARARSASSVSGCRRRRSAPGPSVPSRFSQPGSPSRMSRAIAAARPRIARRARASPRRRPPAPTPGSRLASSVAPGAVRVLVEGEIDLGGGGVDQLEQRLDQRVARERLQMREVQRRARAPGDLDHLADRLEQPGALVADVRDERRAERGRLLGDRDELVGVGVGARDVDEPEREHPRARLEPEPHLAPHLGQLRRRRSDAARRRARPRAPRRARSTARASAPAASPSSASRYSANVVHGHSAGPSPSSARRYACRAAWPPGATGAGASPSGLITSVVKPCRIFGASSGSSNDASAECACRSMNPGQSIAPVPSTTSAASASRDRRPPRSARRARRRPRATGAPVARVDGRARGRADRSLDTTVGRSLG